MTHERVAPDAIRSGLALAPITNQHLSKAAFAHAELRRRILDGELQPGQRLLLRPLAEELALSVMPVRDALRMLEHDGLVSSETHRGATVTQISGATVVEIIGIRMWLEVLAIREAVPRHDPQTIEAAAQQLALAERAIEADDGLTYAQANRSFHMVLEAPAPESLRSLIAEMWERLWQTRRRMSLFSLLPGAKGVAQREHEALFESVRRGDVTAASAAMERHRDSTLRAWRSALAADHNLTASARR